MSRLSFSETVVPFRFWEASRIGVLELELFVTIHQVENCILLPEIYRSVIFSIILEPLPLQSIISFDLGLVIRTDAFT
jgi:hypothetical protein